MSCTSPGLPSLLGGDLPALVRFRHSCRLTLPPTGDDREVSRITGLASGAPPERRVVYDGGCTVYDGRDALRREAEEIVATGDALVRLPQDAVPGDADLDALRGSFTFAGVTRAARVERVVRRAACSYLDVTWTDD